MTRLPQTILGVALCTLASGAIGGAAGASVGQLAPDFVTWIASSGGPIDPALFHPVEFGLGLGIVSGLLLGIPVGLILMSLLIFRDAYLARGGLPSTSHLQGKPRMPIDQEFEAVKF